MFNWLMMVGSDGMPDNVKTYKIHYPSVFLGILIGVIITFFIGVIILFINNSQKSNDENSENDK